MNFRISSENIEIPTEDRGDIAQMFQDKLEKHLQTFDESVENALITVQSQDEERGLMKAKFTMTLPRNQEFHAEAEGEQLFNVMQDLVDKVDTQLRRFKDELQD